MTTDDLRQVPTRLLLSWLKRSRGAGQSGYSPNYPYPPFFTTEQIKAECATRGHIPNKAEGKILRRLQQKAGEKTIPWSRVEKEK